MHDRIGKGGLMFTVQTTVTVVCCKHKHPPSTLTHGRPQSMIAFLLYHKEISKSIAETKKAMMHLFYNG